MKILLIEDDPLISDWLSARLKTEGHVCEQAHTAEQGLQAMQAAEHDLVILDRMLPDADGLALFKRMSGRKHPPVIILSALDSSAERVSGLQAGADDYLGKPFAFAELLLRMELVLRRQQPVAPGALVLVVQDLHIDLLQRKVSRAGRPIDLTAKEFHLLCALAECRGQVVPRGLLLEKVWGLQFDPQTNVIDVHMSKLRAKIDRDFVVPLLRTVRSMGYVLG